MFMGIPMKTHLPHVKTIGSNITISSCLPFKNRVRGGRRLAHMGYSLSRAGVPYYMDLCPCKVHTVFHGGGQDLVRIE